MAEDIVENIRLLEIIKLVAPADEIAGDEAPVGEMVEEDIIRHQTGHRDDLPAGGIPQDPVELLEIGNARPRQLQYVDAVEKRLRCPSRQHLLLAREQDIPGFMVFRTIGLPVLVDRPVRICVRWRLVIDMTVGWGFFGHAP